jgi:glucosylglycerate hydrolase
LSGSTNERPQDLDLDNYSSDLPEKVAATMAARAAHVLGLNSDGDIVKPARDLYPHQWSWDTAFIAIGLSALDVDLAWRNLDALFTGQWRNGMVPHIVFDPDAVGYFPGPERWASAEVSTDAPATPLTSGICQPPVHAIAALRTVRAAAQGDASTASSGLRWAKSFFPKLLSWHRFLVRERTEASTGLVRILHGWESGMDNSPRFDGPYSRVHPGPELPPYERRDLKFVADSAQRPTNREYDKYLWLVEEAKQAGYDQHVLSGSSSFNVGDVFFTALFAAANDDLAELAALVGAPEEAEVRDYAERARAAVAARTGPSGLATDIDLRTGEDLGTGTIAGFAPLIAGRLPGQDLDRLITLLQGPCWAGHPGLRWALPPSTSPCSPHFSSRSYWRGPVWPVTNWLLTWALERAGAEQAAADLRRSALKQVVEAGGLAEYYEPYTGEVLGAANHSWTAAVVVDWLCG